MMLFSAFEGSVSRSGRKKSACYKILYFTIWNVFFVNVLSGTVINQLYSLSSPKDIPTQLAKAVPRQVIFSPSDTFNLFRGFFYFILKLAVVILL